MKLNYEALRQVMLTVQDKSLNPNPIEIVNDVTEKGFTQSDASYALKQAIDSKHGEMHQFLPLRIEHIRFFCDMLAE